MRLHPVRSLLVLALAVGVALLPSASPLEAQGKGTIKIATQSPLSGELAALGEGIKLGAQLAIEKMKGPLEKAGYKIELVPFDDQAKPDVGVANAKNINADKDILVVVGHLNSGVAIPSSEVYKEASLAMISPANTNPTITDRLLPNVYRVCGRDDVQGAVAARFAKENLKAKSVYLVHNKNQYGQGIAEFFQEWAKKNGMTVTGFEGTEERANFDPILTPIKAKNPDVIFFGGEYPQAAPLFRQAREKGIKSQFMGPDGVDSTELLKLGGDAVVGMHFTTVAGSVKEYPKAREFAEAYKKKFGKDPEPFAAQSYDATAIGLKAIEAALKGSPGKTPSREAVAKAVRGVKHAGITGNVNFDEKGDPKIATYLIYQVAKDWKDNKLVKQLDIPTPAAPKKS
ncbi:MAG: branched-chain amino acid ABC transporter substrate-binding protein [Candidatus Rokubacteria bacterium]|nr:branched-chain amino acid ABC transporter substrate-binding protein [Candidatus Rokubacteria bacterium]MBI3825539.1 branched-chain amino acid ABC transporter substrate-binding protein [Candidatus Rokubacteria bacterium]